MSQNYVLCIEKKKKKKKKKQKDNIFKFEKRVSQNAVAKENKTSIYKEIPRHSFFFLKLSNDSPVRKKLRSWYHQKRSYRPISILLAIAKVFEKI